MTNLLIMVRSFSYLFFKRLFDIVFSLFGLVFFFPLLLVVSLLVKITSAGPIFFKGIRTGKAGVLFTIYKFRSMYVGSEKKSGSTSRNDSRITSVGNFLRKYKIDELPQLFNVLIGNMSFVGPRPELKKYTDQYLGEELVILTVKPGITDLSSIYYSNLSDLIDDNDPDGSFEKKILLNKNKLRIQYVQNATFIGDMKLIFMTIYKVLIKR